VQAVICVQSVIGHFHKLATMISQSNSSGTVCLQRKLDSLAHSYFPFDGCKTSWILKRENLVNRLIGRRRNPKKRHESDLGLASSVTSFSNT